MNPHILTALRAAGVSDEAISLIADGVKWPGPDELLVYDWRCYIPLTLREHWDTLCPDVQAVAFLLAERQAMNEEYE